MVPLPARSAEEHAVAVAPEISPVLAEVLGVQRPGRDVACAAGVVDDAGFALAGCRLVEEREELLGEEEV